MKILDRYVGKGVIVTTLIGVVVLSLVLVLGKLFKELLDLLINKDVPIETLLTFMAFVLPFSLTFTLPWGFLTALLLIFGRMSADNELIALRSNGVSIPRICAPVFALAILLTGVCFWINADIAPRAEQKMTETVFDILTSNPMSLFAADEVVDEFPDRRVYVGGKDGDTLKNLIVFEIDKDQAPMKVFYAKRGHLEPDIANKRLLLKFYDARLEQRDKNDPRDIYKIQHGIVLGEGQFALPLDELYKEHWQDRRLESYTLPELTEYIKDRRAENLEPAKVEWNKRFSASLACLAFALVAVPLGITAHRKETSVGFALSLVIAFTYFFFIILANTFRDDPGAYPQLLIWIPNVLFITLGSIMFYRLSRR